MNVDAINTARRIIVCAQNIIEKPFLDTLLKTFKHSNALGSSKSLGTHFSSSFSDVFGKTNFGQKFCF